MEAGTAQKGFHPFRVLHISEWQLLFFSNELLLLLLLFFFIILPLHTNVNKCEQLHVFTDACL